MAGKSTRTIFTFDPPHRLPSTMSFLSRRVFLFIFGMISFSGCANLPIAPVAAPVDGHGDPVVVLVRSENFPIRSKIENDLIEALSPYQSGPVASLSLLRPLNGPALDKDVYDILVRNAEAFSFDKSVSAEEGTLPAPRGPFQFGSIKDFPQSARPLSVHDFEIEVFDLRKNQVTWGSWGLVLNIDKTGQDPLFLRMRIFLQNDEVVRHIFIYLRTAFIICVF